MNRVPDPRGDIDRFLVCLRAAADRVGALRDSMFDESWRPRYPARRAIDTLFQ